MGALKASVDTGAGWLGLGSAAAAGAGAGAGAEVVGAGTGSGDGADLQEIPITVISTDNSKTETIYFFINRSFETDMFLMRVYTRLLLHYKTFVLYLKHLESAVWVFLIICEGFLWTIVLNSTL